ncbi:hypothetical protein ILUMI_06870 [Ignelater luminosus]|uniref:Ankyrin repeat, SAM and basic leucine zipper domain-containing protein 1 n=1 Tax=Ignelater luminosus TaxID=2038154 RepID=A0A8K0D8G2_IGNLU|nr:hypothetical protein ILUMI_06870 [Ignelater luminosus]
MAYPAGFSSDEDEFGGFLSDDSDDLDLADAVQFEAGAQQEQNVGEPQLTMEQKLNNLFYAIMNGNVEQVTSSLENGLDINVVVRDGWSAILLAASIGNSDIVRELINRGADVNSHKDRYTALMAACNCPESTSPASKCLDIVTQLIEHGAAIDATTRTRKTAFMFAASNGSIEIISKLLSCTNNRTNILNAEDNQGWDAMHYNKPQVVKLLLEEGLNPNKMDVRGTTPINYAIMGEHADIIEMFAIEEDTSTTIQDTYYEIETIFDTQFPNEKPQFYLDICRMLYGMKCENLAAKFANVSLLDFLCLNNKTLIELGINIPYQRQRIVTGLYKYHKHLYKQKSIPVIPKDSTYSTIDVSNAIISAVRQLISMEASLRYISYHDVNIHNKKSMPTYIVREKLCKLKKTATALHNLIEVWDTNNPPADLISKDSKKRLPRWLKWFACLNILTVTIIVVNKIRD